MTPDTVEDIYPLSPAQSGMFFHAIEAPGSGVYVEQVHCCIASALDTAAFREAWRLAVQRHPVLRTSFLWEEVDQPVQVVHRDVEVPWEESDWRDAAPGEQALRLTAWLREARQRGFDLAQPPLLRFALMCTGECEYRFAWTYHHLLIDGWSMPLLLAEVFRHYEALQAGRVPAPRHAPSYKAYIEWLSRRDRAAAQAYWRRALEGFSEPTSLPGLLAADRRPAATGQADRSIRIEAAATASLQEFARRHGLTLNTVAQGAWALLLAQACGQPEVLFGAVVAGRPAELPQSEETVGLFVNTVPMRVAIPADVTALAWLQRLQEQQAASRAHEFCALSEVQSWSSIPAPARLFDTLFAFENYPGERALEGLAGALRIRDVHFVEQTHYALSWLVVPGEELVVRALYDPHRCDAGAVGELLTRYRTLLEALVAEPGARLEQLSRLSEAQRRQLDEWNATTRATDRSGGVHEAFLRQAAQTPDAAAVEFGGASLRYRDLEQRSRVLAGRLHRAGVRRGAVVGLYATRSFEALVALLGILRAGAAYLPLDPHYPRERLALMIEDAGVELILGQAGLQAQMPATRATVLLLDDAPTGDGPDAPDAPDEGAGGEDLAYVLFTSGSSGRPKPVAMPHRALRNLLEWQARNSSATAQTRTLQFASLSFDVSFQEIFSTFRTGGTVVLIDDARRRNAESLLAFLREARIERLFLPFAMLQPLADAATRADHLPVLLREIITAGEQLQITGAIRALFRRLDGCVLWNHYGPTETHVVTAHRLEGASEGWPLLPPIGRPIDNVKVHILDERGRPVAPQVAGELYLGGACLAQGYLGRAAMTAERFVAVPDVPLSRLYRTGDVARHRADGAIEFLGRRDEQVKLRGHRVELGEIAAVLAEASCVTECALALEPTTDGSPQLAAYVVLRETASVDALRAHLSTRLPEYMIPAAFVRVDHLPITPSGKLDRRALARTPGVRLESGGGVPADRTPLEELVCEIWAAVLGLPRVGAADDFFALGGHSLLAMQVVSRLRDALQLEIPLQLLFDQRTASRVAGAILGLRGAGVGRLPPLTPRPADLAPPLSFAQERMWISDRLAPGTSDYNISLELRIGGPLRLEVLERCLTEIVRRHEVLRARFAMVDGQPVQHIVPAHGLSIARRDLRASSGGETEVEALTLREAEAAFDLARDPPLRVLALHLADTEHRLIVTLHHIAFDGWSLGVLARELAALYGAYSGGDASPLPELAVQYADVAHGQRLLVRGEFLERELAYWRARLAGAPPALELPLDHPRSALRPPRSAAQRFRLDARLATALRRTGREAGATLFMSLLAAFHALLHRYTGQHTTVVGTPLANRLHPEAEALIGCFINPLPLRADVDGELKFFDLLLQVRATVLEAFEHQAVPFERIVQALAPDRDPARMPLFQVLFVLQNFPMPRLELPGLTVEARAVEVWHSIFDLSLTMWEDGDELCGVLEYNAALFEPHTVAGFVDHYRVLLDRCAREPEARIGAVPLLGAEQRAKVLALGQPAHPAAPETCAHALFEAQARRSPTAIAIRAGDEALSYAELQGRAAGIAASLRSRGIGPDAVVGLLAERSIASVAGVLGILMAGAAFLPLDPGLPRRRLRFLLEDAGVTVVGAQARFEGLLAGTNVSFVALDGDVHDAGIAATFPDPATVRPHHLAYVLYTSGSTGTPKGVMIEHRALTHYIAAAIAAYRIAPGDRVLQFAALSFDTSLEEIFPCLCAGATLVLRDPGPPASIPEFVSRCDRLGITVLSLPTAYWHTWAEQIHLVSVRPPESLRLVVLGGEKASFERARAWRGALGDRVRLLNTYGPTEATIIATLCDLGACWNAAELASEVPIGRPIDGVRVYVLDEQRRLVPIGLPGELHIAGAGLARGYVNRAEETAARFVVDPFSAAGRGRMFRSGDRARWGADGQLHFLGRRDDQVKLRGYRIELAEIESVLAQHPQVREAAAFERDGRLQACIAQREGTLVVAAEVRAFLGERLPDYMVPAHIGVLDALPRTTSGKIDRGALPLAAPDAVPPPASLPRTDLEQQLAQLWSQLLGVGSIDVETNFFELGGHSLQAIQLLARIQETLGVELPAQVLFQAPTIARLALAVDRIRAGGVIAPVPVVLEAEAVLDDAIRPDAAQPGAAVPEGILLTGAAGFLGAHLLSRLLRTTQARIHCLIRADDGASGLRRIQAALASYGLGDPALEARIVAVPGDLERPLFGLTGDRFAELSRAIDAIFHNGAAVNAAAPYAMLKAANVGGTHEAIRLASAGKRKTLHFVSTLSVFAAGGRGGRALGEDDEVHAGRPPAGGYAQSKWVAERLVRLAAARGLACAIYRPGRIGGDSRRGLGQAQDLLGELFRACRHIGSLPDLDFMVDVAPVDYVAAAIVHLSQGPVGAARVFHLNHPQAARWSDIVCMLRTLGIDWPLVPFGDWRRALRAAARELGGLPTLTLLLADPGWRENAGPEEQERPAAAISCANTLAGLAGSGIVCPPLDAGLLGRYVSDLERAPPYTSS